MAYSHLIACATSTTPSPFCPIPTNCGGAKNKGRVGWDLLYYFGAHEIWIPCHVPSAHLWNYNFISHLRSIINACSKASCIALMFGRLRPNKYVTFHLLTPYPLQKEVPMEYSVTVHCHVLPGFVTSASLVPQAGHLTLAKGHTTIQFHTIGCNLVGLT